MDKLSDTGTSMDESDSEKHFEAFRDHLKTVQILVEGYNSKMVDKTLCADDLANMQREMQKLTILEQKVVENPKKLRSNYVTYRTISLKMVQDSYRLCNWLINQRLSEVDNVFDIDTFVDKIFQACDGQENPLDYINTLFKGVIRSPYYFNLNFYGNILPNESDDSSLLTQCKREYRKSQKRQLEELVVPDEADNEMVDNELQMSLKRVNRCLKEAISKNQGKPISFYKFAMDPFSLTYTVENLFNLATLVKDGVVKIERVPGDNHDEFTTISIAKTKNKKENKDKIRASFFSINEELWKFYVKKYNVTERLIEQDN